MVSAWALVTLASSAALACGYAALRLARRPRRARK
jgi:hypothetical protein